MVGLVASIHAFLPERDVEIFMLATKGEHERERPQPLTYAARALPRTASE